MFVSTIFALFGVLSMGLGQTETVLGVYMFHRHGDRTAKILGPTNLTDLGYLEVYQSGQYYRDRYIDSNGPYHIQGISPKLVNLDQIQASAPDDNVLQNSAMGFLQGLYPPAGAPLDTETLANGSSVTAPFSGYQLIPVELVESGSGSEDNSWLQSASGCYQAELSSNECFVSAPYLHLLSTTRPLYQKLLPLLDGEFNSTEATYQNAYEIWDYINVSEIHNATIPDSDLLTPSVLHELFTLASAHEWGLAYNSSEPIRSIAGRTLAAQVTQFLNSTITAAGSLTGPKYAVQFGAYSSFMSYFGDADLTSVNVDFYGITNYASSMVWEMFTNISTAITTSNFPREDDIYVRFLYHNGTASTGSPPVAYPLFGTGQDALKWSDFLNHMNSFSIGETGQWCHACGNTTGICSSYSSSGSDSGTTSTDSHSQCPNGISPTINGVIGAVVTLAVILGVEALIMLVLGVRVVKKNKRGRSPESDTVKTES